MDQPLSVARIRALDRFTIETVGVPGSSLMEVAGYGAAREIARRLAAGSGPQHCAVVTGSGNNAGDGFVVARWLRSFGHEVSVHALVAPESFAPGDARDNATVLPAYGLTVQPFDAGGALPESATLLVDALLGTGLRGEVRSPYRETIAALRAHPAPVVSLDLPSGLDGDSGEVLGAAVMADCTVTFGAPKLGFSRAAGPEHVGELVVVPLPFPPGLPDPLPTRAP